MHLARCLPKLLQKYFGSLNYGPPCLYRVGQEKMIEKKPIFGQIYWPKIGIPKFCRPKGNSFLCETAKFHQIMSNGSKVISLLDRPPH